MTDEEDSAINTADIGASGAISILSAAVSTGLSTGDPGREGKTNDRAEDLFEWVESKAEAAVQGCGRLAAADVCTNRTKSASYNNCFTGTGGTTYSGTVGLSYSDASCGLPINGIVTRTSNIFRTTSNKSSVRTTSDARSDYRGISIGGGSTITRNAAGFAMTITGLHKIRTSSKGKSIYDLSVRTLTPMTITDPSSSNMIVNGGSFEVSHNNAQYVATLTPNNLFYNYTSCCYPRSGSLTAVYSGSYTGTAVISFSSTCGEATLAVPGGEQATITLVGCD